MNSAPGLKVSGQCGVFPIANGQMAGRSRPRGEPVDSDDEGGDLSASFRDKLDFGEEQGEVEDEDVGRSPRSTQRWFVSDGEKPFEPDRNPRGLIRPVSLGKRKRQLQTRAPPRPPRDESTEEFPGGEEEEEDETSKAKRPKLREISRSRATVSLARPASDSDEMLSDKDIFTAEELAEQKKLAADIKAYKVEFKMPLEYKKPQLSFVNLAGEGEESSSSTDVLAPIPGISKIRREAAIAPAKPIALSDDEEESTTPKLELKSQNERLAAKEQPIHYQEEEEEEEEPESRSISPPKAIGRMTKKPGLAPISLSSNDSESDVSMPPEQQVFFAFPANYGNITLYGSDLDRLKPKAFLNDNVMMAYIYDLYHSSSYKSDFFIFNSFFFSALKDPAQGFQRVKNFYRGVNLFKYRFALAVIHQDFHWTLGVICNASEVGDKKYTQGNPYIILIDSLGTPAASDADYLRTYLTEIVKERWPYARIGPFTPATIPTLIPTVPQQPNGYDCGIYALQFAQRLFAYPPFNLPADPVAASQIVSKELSGPVHPNAYRNAVRRRLVELKELFTAPLSSSSESEESSSSESSSSSSDSE